MVRVGYDLAVIGAGGGGFAAAIAARRRGLSVVMVEAGTVGGGCVNTGCVPSKALLAAAAARRAAGEGRFPGIGTSAWPADVAALVAGKNDLVGQLRADKYVGLAAEYGWQIIAGRAQFVGDAEDPVVEVGLAAGGTTRIGAGHYLVATGSRPWMPPVAGLADVGFLTSTTAMDLDALPTSLLVVGGNYVGLEQAQLFAGLGSRVMIVEMADRLAPGEEPEVSAAIEAVFAAENITVRTGSTVTSVAAHEDGVSAGLLGRGGAGAVVRAQRVLMATGRRPVTDGLGLDRVGVRVGDRGEIVVDDRLRSTHPRVWAAGDVTGGPQFVYVAATHGTLVVDNAFAAADRRVDYRHLPRVAFTSPSIAAVGLTEARALEAGIDCEYRVLPLTLLPRAVVNRDTRGMVKLVAETGTGRLLGASVVADNAGDVIAAAGYALRGDLTVAQIAEMWCAYLTTAEGLKLAAQAFGTDVSKLSCCAA
jgi:mercuric reductase